MNMTKDDTAIHMFIMYILVIHDLSTNSRLNLIIQKAWERKKLYTKQKDITLEMIEQVLNGSNALSVRMDRFNRIALDRYFNGVPKKGCGHSTKGIGDVFQYRRCIAKESQ